MRSPQSRLSPSLVEEIRGPFRKNDFVNSNVVPIAAPRVFGGRMFSVDNIEQGVSEQKRPPRPSRIDLSNFGLNKKRPGHPS